jgi:hypothetical protein
MTYTFTTPATSTGVDWKQVNGALLLINVLGVDEAVQTVHGVTDAVRANISVLDGDLKGETFEDTLVFPRVLKSQLKSKVGQLVLGRLGQGTAKPGQSAPWQLVEATDADKSVANAYLKAQPEIPAPF